MFMVNRKMRGIAAFEKREERKERFVKEINFRYVSGTYTCCIASSNNTRFMTALTSL